MPNRSCRVRTGLEPDGHPVASHYFQFQLLVAATAGFRSTHPQIACFGRFFVSRSLVDARFQRWTELLLAGPQNRLHGTSLARIRVIAFWRFRRLGRPIGRDLARRMGPRACCWAKGFIRPDRTSSASLTSAPAVRWKRGGPHFERGRWARSERRRFQTQFPWRDSHPITAR